MKHPYMIGKKLYLRGLEREDLGKSMFQWANDPKVTHFMFMGAKPNTLEALNAEYDALLKSDKDVIFAIIDKKSDRHIGNAGLYAINWISRSGEYRIVIGDPNCHGKGYGQETAKLILQYGFDKLNLNKIYLGVNASNKMGVACYKKAGFIEEGVLRQEIYRNGQYYDAVRMSILRKEFYGKKA